MADFGDFLLVVLVWYITLIIRFFECDPGVVNLYFDRHWTRKLGN